MAPPDQQSWWRPRHVPLSEITESNTRRFDVSPVALGVALTGAATMLLSLFLPYAESKQFAKILENTLIQHGEGVPLIFIAVGTAALAYGAYRRRRRSWGVMLMGVLAIGLAIYYGTSDDLLTLGSATKPDESLPLEAYLEQLTDTEKASPGVGVYVAGVGGLLALIGGWMIWRSEPLSAEAAAEPESGRSTKRCPDCAEDVLADAKVCKHCGFRFEPS